LHVTFINAKAAYCLISPQLVCTDLKQAEETQKHQCLFVPKKKKTSMLVLSRDYAYKQIQLRPLLPMLLPLLLLHF
jgi:hypothetical protein